MAESGNWCELKMVGNNHDKIFRCKSQIVVFQAHIHLPQKLQEYRSEFQKMGFTSIEGEQRDSMSLYLCYEIMILIQLNSSYTLSLFRKASMLHGLIAMA